MMGVFKATEEKSPESPRCMVTSPWMKLTRATPWLLSLAEPVEPGAEAGSGPGGAWAAAEIAAKPAKTGIANQASFFVFIGHLIQCPTRRGARRMPNRPKQGLIYYCESA